MKRRHPGDKKLGVGAKTLTLKRGVETGTVRQSFSHGRSKQVVVEKVKRRVIGAPGDTKAGSPRPRRKSPPKRAPPAASAAERPAAAAAPKSGVVLRTLTEDERMRARQRACGRARARSRRTQALPKKTRAAAKAAKSWIRPSAKPPKRASARKMSVIAARKRPSARPNRKPRSVWRRRHNAQRTPGARPALEAEEEEGPRNPRRGAGRRRASRRRSDDRRVPTAQKQRGRLTLVTALSADEVRERSVASFRRRTQRLKGHASDEPKEKLIREVIIPETITIQELANRMAERGVDVIRLLMKQGHMATINDVIDADTAQLIAEELGHTVKRVAESDVEEGLFSATMPTMRRACSRARRSSPSWATSITARRRCSTPSARPKWRPAKPAASPSISAPIR